MSQLNDVSRVRTERRQVCDSIGRLAGGAQGASAIAGETGGEAWVVDLTDTAALETLALDVDVLVNNAGVQHVAPIEEFPPDQLSAQTCTVTS